MTNPGTPVQTLQLARRAMAFANQRTATHLATVGRFARSSPMGAGALCVLLALGTAAIFASTLAPHDPVYTNPTNLLEPPSSRFLLGTDYIGRDVLSRVIHGARVSLLVAFVAISTGGSMGFVWGLVSGYAGGQFDLLSQRLLDILQAIPTIILALLLVVALGVGLHAIMIAIAMVFIPGTTRLVRSSALSTKEMPYVEASRAIGASSVRVMLLHVTPQCIAPFLVLASFYLGIAIFAEASLSFLGLGIPPPHSTWGNMLGGVLSQIFKPPWWLVIFPGMAITITVLCFNLLGDALRDFLDPRLRGRLE